MEVSTQTEGGIGRRSSRNSKSTSDSTGVQQHRKKMLRSSVCCASMRRKSAETQTRLTHKDQKQFITGTSFKSRAKRINSNKSREGVYVKSSCNLVYKNGSSIKLCKETKRNNSEGEFSFGNNMINNRDCVLSVDSANESVSISNMNEFPHQTNDFCVVEAFPSSVTRPITSATKLAVPSQSDIYLGDKKQAFHEGKCEISTVNSRSKRISSPANRREKMFIELSDGAFHSSGTQTSPRAMVNVGIATQESFYDDFNLTFVTDATEQDQVSGSPASYIYSSGLFTTDDENQSQHGSRLHVTDNHNLLSRNNNNACSHYNSYDDNPRTVASHEQFSKAQCDDTATVDGKDFIYNRSKCVDNISQRFPDVLSQCERDDYSLAEPSSPLSLSNVVADPSDLALGANQLFMLPHSNNSINEPSKIISSAASFFTAPCCNLSDNLASIYPVTNEATSFPSSSVLIEDENNVILRDRPLCEIRSDDYQPLGALKSSVCRSNYEAYNEALKFSEIRSSSIETQTEHDVLLSGNILPASSSSCTGSSVESAWCNIETQTCEDFSEIEKYLCSTIQTQTPDQLRGELFPELSLADTETQTASEDSPYLVHTHTQTCMSEFSAAPVL